MHHVVPKHNEQHASADAAGALIGKLPGIVFPVAKVQFVSKGEGVYGPTGAGDGDGACEAQLVSFGPLLAATDVIHVAFRMR